MVQTEGTLAIYEAAPIVVDKNEYEVDPIVATTLPCEKMKALEASIFSNLSYIVTRIADNVVEVVKGDEDLDREVTNDEFEVRGSTSPIETDKRSIDI